MTIKPIHIKQMLYVDPDLEWTFRCSYDTNYEVSKDMEVEHQELTESFSVSGANFAFDFKFFETTKFETVQSTPAYKVGERINFGGNCVHHGQAALNHSFS